MRDPILPVDFDRDTGLFFAAAREHRLVYRACRTCGAGIHPPVQSCGSCRGHDTEWREASGKGRLYSWTTITHQVHPAYPAPYTIVLVELEEAPDIRLVGRLPGMPELIAGQPMRVWFEPLSAEHTLPNWEPVSPQSMTAETLS